MKQFQKGGVKSVSAYCVASGKSPFFKLQYLNFFTSHFFLAFIFSSWSKEGVGNHVKSQSVFCQCWDFWTFHEAENLGRITYLFFPRAQLGEDLIRLKSSAPWKVQKSQLRALTAFTEFFFIFFKIWVFFPPIQTGQILQKAFCLRGVQSFYLYIFS